MMRLGRFFRAHGEFCASHPWEVIVGLVTFTACILSLEKGNADAPQQPPVAGDEPLCYSWRYGAMTRCEETERNMIDVILMMVVRGAAILYVYYHLCNLQRLGSRYLLVTLGRARAPAIYRDIVAQPSAGNQVHALPSLLLGAQEEVPHQPLRIGCEAWRSGLRCAETTHGDGATCSSATFTKPVTS
uniref:Uncharacterized protein n=1 Tax=Anopheles merus TaxID=30066 RepID=A0A182VBY9_ANOME